MKIAYVIGRFQPFHIGHARMVERALDVADRVVVVIGDTGCRPDYKNPWTVEERVQMIQENFKDSLERIRFTSVEDIPYDDNAWANAVREAVANDMRLADPRRSEQFLVGYKKDGSSFYLELFPEWQFVEVEPIETDGVTISATDIRKSIFDYGEFVANINTISKETAAVITSAMGHSRFVDISREARAVSHHKWEWDCPATRKYGGPVIAAVDALLHTQDSVLLIRRGGGVGKGALALPGGFVDPSERLVDAALRELHEETGIKIDRWMLPGNSKVIPFDHPGRSMRGRIITNVLPICVDSLPALKRDLLNTIETPVAGDDAAEALWIEKRDLPGLKREFFSDHYHIINEVLN